MNTPFSAGTPWMLCPCHTNLTAASWADWRVSCGDKHELSRSLSSPDRKKYVSPTMMGVRGYFILERALKRT